MTVILSSLYNAPIQYYSKLLLQQPVIIDVCEYYVKQSYRNRCVIYSADGPMSLSIPVSYSSSSKDRVKDVRISYDTNWVHLHWNAIVSSYSSTPFFEYYRDEYEAVYKKKYKFLIELNAALFSTTFSFLKINDYIDFSYSENYVEPDSSDYRNLIHPKKEYKQDILYKDIPYYQVFSDKFGFQPNLSILDLLFNMGNESLLILLKTINL